VSSLNRFVTLGEISERIGDGLHGTPEYSKNGEYFFINGNNLIDGEIILNEKTKSCSESEYDKYKKNLSNNTILISINGTIGNLAFYKGENVILGKSACYINIKSDVDKNFIYYALKSSKFQNYIKSQATGSTIKNVSLKLLRDYVLELPDIIQQKRISKILSNLDDKIRINNQINQTLESIAQAIFKSWFIDFDPVRAKIAAKQEGKDSELAAMCAISGKSETELEQMAEDDFAELQATAALFPDELVGSELGEVPKGWSVSKVDDILKRIKIKKRFKKNDVNEFGQTFVLEQGSNIILGFHDNEGNISASKEEPAFIFGDHTCITRLMLSNFDVSENVIAVTGKERNSYWTYYAIKDLQKFQEYRRHWMELTSKQVVVADVRLTDYFAKKVKILHEDIEYSLRENLVLMNLRNTLLPKLLSGEIDISVMNREQI
jgi:type I restriction enzyme S subunit